MRINRYTTVVAAVLLGACGEMYDPNGEGNERRIAGAVDNGVCQKIRFDNEEANPPVPPTELTLGSKPITTTGHLKIDVVKSGWRTGACGDKGVLTQAYRLTVANDSQISMRLLGADNLRLLIYQEEDWSGSPRGLATWEHNRSVPGQEVGSVSQNDLPAVTFKETLPRGSYIIAVTVTDINQGWWVLRSSRYPLDAPASVEYKLWVSAPSTGGQCGSIKLPERLVLEENTEWAKPISSRGDLQFRTMPSFTMRNATPIDIAAAEAASNGHEPDQLGAFSEDPTFGFMKNDIPVLDFLERYKVGGLNADNRILRWDDANGNLIGFSIEDTTGNTDLNRIRIIGCDGKLIGGVNEEKATGSFVTQYRITNADGFTVGWSLLGELVDYQTATKYTQIRIVDKMGDQQKIYATITRTKNYMADQWVIDSSMAPKAGDVYPGTEEKDGAGNIIPGTGKPYPYIDPRLYVFSGAGKTSAQNGKQYYECSFKSFNLNQCSDCCMNNGAGQRNWTGSWCECQ